MSAASPSTRYLFNGQSYTSMDEVRAVANQGQSARGPPSAPISARSPPPLPAFAPAARFNCQASVVPVQSSPPLQPQPLRQRLQTAPAQQLPNCSPQPLPLVNNMKRGSCPAEPQLFGNNGMKRGSVPMQPYQNGLNPVLMAVPAGTPVDLALGNNLAPRKSVAQAQVSAVSTGIAARIVATGGSRVSMTQTQAMAPLDPDSTNPFNPIYFAFDPRTRDFYRDTFGTRHHTTGQGRSDGSHGPVSTPGKSTVENCKTKGHEYNETVGTNAALYVSEVGGAPTFVSADDAFEILQKGVKSNAIKVGGFVDGMKSLDFYNSIGQVCPIGDKEFYGKIEQDSFDIKDKAMEVEYLEALERVVDPLVAGIVEMSEALPGASSPGQFVVHWDGDELYDADADCFNNYGPLVWAIAACLNKRGKLGTLLAVKNARTKWTKAIGSEPAGTAEDKWFQERNGKPREDFASRYFRESKICEMMEFVQQRGGSVPFYYLTHSTEKNKHVSQRQDDSHGGYFGASVQSGMAQGQNKMAAVVMFGDGDVIYNELSSATWKDGAAKKTSKGYKPGTTIFALDVQRKDQTERSTVFDKEGEPADMFKNITGKRLVTDSSEKGYTVL